MCRCRNWECCRGFIHRGGKTNMQSVQGAAGPAQHGHSLPLHRGRDHIWWLLKCGFAWQAFHHRTDMKSVTSWPVHPSSPPPPLPVSPPLQPSGEEQQVLKHPQPQSYLPLMSPASVPHPCMEDFIFSVVSQSPAARLQKGPLPSCQRVQESNYK